MRFGRSLRKQTIERTVRETDEPIEIQRLEHSVESPTNTNGTDSITNMATAANTVAITITDTADDGTTTTTDDAGRSGRTSFVLSFKARSRRRKKEEKEEAKEEEEVKEKE